MNNFMSSLIPYLQNRFPFNFYPPTFSRRNDDSSFSNGSNHHLDGNISTLNQKTLLSGFANNSSLVKSHSKNEIKKFTEIETKNGQIEDVDKSSVSLCILENLKNKSEKQHEPWTEFLFNVRNSLGEWKMLLEQQAHSLLNGPPEESGKHLSELEIQHHTMQSLSQWKNSQIRINYISQKLVMQILAMQIRNSYQTNQLKKKIILVIQLLDLLRVSNSQMKRKIITLETLHIRNSDYLEQLRSHLSDTRGNIEELGHKWQEAKNLMESKLKEHQRLLLNMRTSSNLIRVVIGEMFILLISLWILSLMKRIYLNYPLRILYTQVLTLLSLRLLSPTSFLSSKNQIYQKDDDEEGNNSSIDHNLDYGDHVDEMVNDDHEHHCEHSDHHNQFIKKDDDNNMNNEAANSTSNPQNDDDDNFLLEGISEDTDMIDLTHQRVRNLKSLESFKHLEILCLRQNLLESMFFIKNNIKLEELDLYDNRINSISHLEKLKKLKILDLSFNNIRSIKNLDSLSDSLNQLYLVSNLIDEISGLDHLHQLRILELGANHISVLKGFEGLSNSLEQLWLGKNRIREINSNLLTKITGLSGLTSLEELYLSHNKIEKIEGLEHNTRLRILDISHNKISKIENISHLAHLEEFWANHNMISKFEELSELSGLKQLTTVYLEGNPIEKSNSQYRLKIKMALPRLKQIDALLTRPLNYLPDDRHAT